MGYRKKLSPILCMRIKELGNKQTVDSKKPIKVLIKIINEKAKSELNKIDGVKMGRHSNKVITASIPLAKIEMVTSIEGIDYIDLVKTTKPERGEM